MCAVKISDLTLEKMNSSKREQACVKLWDSPEQSNTGRLNINFEKDRVLWCIDLTSASGKSEVEPFDIRCWEKFDVSMVVNEGQRVYFNTTKDSFASAFDRLSCHDYQIKATLGCVRVCIEGRQIAHSTGVVIGMIDSLKVPVLQLAECNDSISILIEERYLPSVLAGLSSKLKVS